MRLRPAEIQDRASALRELQSPCRLCPRECMAARAAGRVGFCQATDALEISDYGAHFGEELELVGTRGSGTIFFTHCSLGCAFCQNYSTSHGGRGRHVTPAELGTIMLALERQGCANVNLVTPTHYAPQIIEAVGLARGAGLGVPVVWNSSGYESVAALEPLEGIVDIYMPDAKFGDEGTAVLLCDAEGYPETMVAALLEMQRQVGDLVCGSDGLAAGGLLIRHLVMPGNLAASDEVLRLIATRVSPHAAVNVMSQYRPCGAVAGARGPLGRRVTRDEHGRVVGLAQALGLRVLG